MTARFNPPPSWPAAPPSGWVPPEGWETSLPEGSVPAGWRVSTDAVLEQAVPLPAQDSEDVIATGSRPRSAGEGYPVLVVEPGVFEDRAPAPDYHGFPAPAAPRRRRRLIWTIVLVLGCLALAAGVACTATFLVTGRWHLPAVEALAGPFVLVDALARSALGL